MNPLTYLIKFEGEIMPIRLYAKHYEEYKMLVDREVAKRGKLFEWIIRVYE